MYFAGWGKMTTFAAKFEEVLLLMSIHNIFGIPFRIVSCSGEAASQFYNPLQERVSSDKRAVLVGEDTANMARNLFMNDYQFNHYSNN